VSYGGYGGYGSYSYGYGHGYGLPNHPKGAVMDNNGFSGFAHQLKHMVGGYSGLHTWNGRPEGYQNGYGGYYGGYGGGYDRINIGGHYYPYGGYGGGYWGGGYGGGYDHINIGGHYYPYGSMQYGPGPGVSGYGDVLLGKQGASKTQGAARAVKGKGH